ARTDKPRANKFSRLSAGRVLKSPHLSATHPAQIHRKFFWRGVRAVSVEQIFRGVKAKIRSNMRILQGFLPQDTQIFADENLIGSSPFRLGISRQAPAYT
ncbi:MAG: hypothetical protein IJ012_01950, partial [Clostridia bacterium]|nr:hypothetical protein [Clostridia bacterium]